MAITTLTSSELNQDVGRAKRAAKDGPVFITDRGRPAHVLMTIEHYRRIAGATTNLLDALSMPGLSAIDFEPHRVAVVLRPLDVD